MFALAVHAPVAAAPQQRAPVRRATLRAAPRARNVSARGKGATYTVTPVQADTVNGVNQELVQKCINAIRWARGPGAIDHGTAWGPRPPTRRLRIGRAAATPRAHPGPPLASPGSSPSMG